MCIQEDLDHHGRIIGRLTTIGFAVNICDRSYVQFIYHIGDEVSKMITGKPFTKRWGGEKVGLDHMI